MKILSALLFVIGLASNAAATGLSSGVCAICPGGLTSVSTDAPLQGNGNTTPITIDPTSNITISSITVNGNADATGYTESGSNTLSNDISGSAATATSFVFDPTDCPAGQAPSGVDTSGNAVSCTEYINTTGNQSKSATLTLSGANGNLIAGASVTASGLFSNTLETEGIGVGIAAIPGSTFGALIDNKLIALQARNDSRALISALSGSNVGSDAPEVVMSKARGSIAAPAACQSGDRMGSVIFKGYNGSIYADSAIVRSICQATHSGTDRASRMDFLVTAAGSTARSTVLTLDDTLRAGVNTINPTTDLDVVGDGNFSGFVDVAGLLSADGGLQLDTITSLTGTGIYLDSNNELRFQPGSSGFVFRNVALNRKNLDITQDGAVALGGDNARLEIFPRTAGQEPKVTLIPNSTGDDGSIEFYNTNGAALEAQIEYHDTPNRLDIETLVAGGMVSVNGGNGNQQMIVTGSSVTVRGNVEAASFLTSVLSTAASEGASTTTSATYQQKLRLSTTTVAGIYKISWYMEYTNQSNNQLTQVKIEADDTTILGENQSDFSTSSTFLSFAGHINMNLTAAAHTFDLDFRAVSGTAEVRRARIEIERRQ